MRGKGAPRRMNLSSRSCCRTNAKMKMIAAETFEKERLKKEVEELMERKQEGSTRSRAL